MNNSIETKPKLYTKTAILVFSTLLTTFFGSLLFAQNIKEAGRKKEILNIVLFGIFWNIIQMKILEKFFHINILIHFFVNALGGLVLTIPFWNYYLKEIIDFNRKKIWAPLFVVVIFVGGFLILFLLNTRK